MGNGPGPSAALGALGVVLVLVALGACSGVQQASGKVKVVAAEDFWGSIAAQLGGSAVSVHSLITNPKVDPHSFEPTADDAGLIAEGRLVIVNGIGYDEWASRLLAAAGGKSRLVLNVGDLLGLAAGSDPHQWYSPPAVEKVARAISADLIRLDPNARSYFEARLHTFETVDLAPYHRLLDQIRSHYAGVPVGYSESIFTPLGEYLKLKLVTPYQFAKDIAEGVEVGPTLQEEVEGEAQRRQLAVWVYNSQNATPVVQRINRIASAAHIPIVTITETLDPAADTFEQWQVTELERLQTALREATRG